MRPSPHCANDKNNKFPTCLLFSACTDTRLSIGAIGHLKD